MPENFRIACRNQNFTTKLNCFGKDQNQTRKGVLRVRHSFLKGDLFILLRCDKSLLRVVNPKINL